MTAAKNAIVKAAFELKSSHVCEKRSNVKNEDNECFRWCHARLLNPQERNLQRIKKSDREMVQKLNYQGIKFPVNVKDYAKIEVQNSININVFGYEDEQFYPIYVSIFYHWEIPRKRSPGL